MVAIVRLAALAIELQRSKSSIRNDIKAGTFPAPIRTGKRSIGFLRSEVEAWLAARAAARTPSSGSDAQGAQ